jgi:hypothetical protein
MQGARPHPCAAVAAGVREMFGGSGGTILLNHRGELGVARTALKMPHALAHSGCRIVAGD